MGLVSKLERVSGDSGNLLAAAKGSLDQWAQKDPEVAATHILQSQGQTWSMGSQMDPEIATHILQSPRGLSQQA